MSRDVNIPESVVQSKRLDLVIRSGREFKDLISVTRTTNNSSLII